MKRVLKILGIILVVLLVFIVIAGVGIFLASNSKLAKTYNVEVALIDIPSDEESLAEGERLFKSRGCTDCHEKDAGGHVMIDDPAMGKIAAPNLTSGEGGVGADYETEDWIRSIRHGIAPDGKSLVIMPSHEYAEMRDEELGQLIAYLQNLPPVDGAQPEPSYGPVGRALLVFGELDLEADLIDHDTIQGSDVSVGATIEYGEYLAHQTCVGCHQSNFAGGESPGFDVAVANITPSSDGIGDWEFADFQTAIQTGVTPDGTTLDTIMPWESFAQMNDTEVEALWLYLQTVEPVSD